MLTAHESNPALDEPYFIGFHTPTPPIPSISPGGYEADYRIRLALRFLIRFLNPVPDIPAIRRVQPYRTETTPGIFQGIILLSEILFALGVILACRRVQVERKFAVELVEQRLRRLVVEFLAAMQRLSCLFVQSSPKSNLRASAVRPLISSCETESSNSAVILSSPSIISRANCSSSALRAQSARLGRHSLGRSDSC